ncbi:MAG: glycoside hydrolase family 5 protein [Phycisphaerae bacterium]
MAALAKGVNLSGWYAQLAPDKERFKNYIQPEDIKLLSRLGCRHARVIIEPRVLMTNKDPSVLDVENLKLFDASLDMILAGKLAVMICPYYDDKSKWQVLTDATAARAFGAFWGALAKHVSARDPDMVFLQVMNEPSTNDQTLWNNLQACLVGRIRRAAPGNTIVAVSNMRANGNWDLIGGLEQLQPVKDPNVVYDFHFYDPVQFTHQGATWMTPQVAHYKDLPYPSSVEAIQPFLKGIKDDSARSFAALYGRERWGRERIDRQIKRAANWARRFKAPIICSEFGCYRQNTPADGRNRYLRDVRETLEKYGIGWTHWDYVGDFGIVTVKDGKRVLDKDTAGALGLSADLPTTATAPAAP